MTKILISDNGISKVWREGPFIFKRQPAFLTVNDIYCLRALYPSGYIPLAYQVEPELIKMEYIENQPITNSYLLWHHFSRIIKALKDAGIRHGDLTERNVLVRDNHPFIIDFAESRLTCDPRMDKRPGSDEEWLKGAFKKLCGG